MMDRLLAWWHGHQERTMLHVDLETRERWARIEAAARLLDDYEAVLDRRQSDASAPPARNVPPTP
jgi:hypothetical protein